MRVDYHKFSCREIAALQAKAGAGPRVPLGSAGSTTVSHNSSIANPVLDASAWSGPVMTDPAVMAAMDVTMTTPSHITLNGTSLNTTTNTQVCTGAKCSQLTSQNPDNNVVA